MKHHRCTLDESQLLPWHVTNDPRRADAPTALTHAGPMTPSNAESLKKTPSVPYKVPAGQQRLGQAAADLTATACARLGMDTEQTQGVLRGEPFGRQTGFRYQVQPDGDNPAARVRLAVSLPLSTFELMPSHLARLFEVQAVLVSSMGWSLGIEPESGVVQLTSLAAAHNPERLLADIDIGTAMASSVLQLALNDAISADSAPGINQV
ncbi:MAG: hypothetical protein ACK40L_02140 [Hydrogenophaga sp.]